MIIAYRAFIFRIIVIQFQYNWPPFHIDVNGFKEPCLRVIS